MALGQVGGDVLVAAPGVVAALFALYLMVIAVAALLDGGPQKGAEGSQGGESRIVVLVPAHDEARIVASCLESLRAQTYPPDLYEVVVVADNCTDDTADVAARAGATVLVRDDPAARGKGHALRFAIDRLLARDRPPDAVVVVDADSLAVSEFLALMVRRFEEGHSVVQGESILFDDGGPQAGLRVAAFLLVNHVRPRGRAALGLPCGLFGNGMLVARAVLMANPWGAFTSAEDLEYALDLRAAGLGAAFARGAIVRTASAPTARAAEQQAMRWQGGKLHLARTRLPGLVAAGLRERRLLLLDAALELAVPPLGLLAGTATTGCTIASILAATGAIPVWPVVPWLLALVAVPIYVTVGLAAARAPASVWLALAGAPIYVWTSTLRSHRLVRFRGDTWVRTERPNDP